MELADVDRVDETFEALKPVTSRDCDHRTDVIGREQVELEVRDWWCLRGIAEIYPDHAARFGDRIGLWLDSGSELGSMSGWFSRHIDAVTCRIEGPTVIEAGERIAVVVGECEGSSTMGHASSRQPSCPFRDRNTTTLVDSARPRTGSPPGWTRHARMTGTQN